MAFTAYSPNVATLPSANVATLPSTASTPIPSFPSSATLPRPVSLPPRYIPQSGTAYSPGIPSALPRNNIVPFPRNTPTPPVELPRAPTLPAKTTTPTAPRLTPSPAAIATAAAIALLDSEPLRRQGEWGKRSIERLYDRKPGDKPWPGSPFPDMPPITFPDAPRTIGSLGIRYRIRSEIFLSGVSTNRFGASSPITYLGSGSPSVSSSSIRLGPIQALMVPFYSTSSGALRWQFGWYYKNQNNIGTSRESHAEINGTQTFSDGSKLRWSSGYWNVTAIPVEAPPTVPEVDPDQLPKPEEVPDTIPTILPPGIPDPVYPDPVPQEDDPKIPDVIPEKLPPGLPDKEPPSFPQEDEPPQPDEQPEEPLPGIPPIEPTPREPEPKEPEEPEPDILPPAITPQPLPSLPEPVDDPDKIPAPFPSIPSPVPDESPTPIPSLPTQPQPDREDTPDDLPIPRPTPFPNPFPSTEPEIEPGRQPVAPPLPGENPSTTPQIPTEPQTPTRTPTIPLIPPPFAPPIAPPFNPPTTPGTPPFNPPQTPQTPASPVLNPPSTPYAPSYIPGTPNQPLPPVEPTSPPDMPFPPTVSPPSSPPSFPPLSPAPPITPPEPCTCAPATPRGEEMPCLFDINAIRAVVQQELQTLENAVGVTEFPKVLPVLANGGIRVIQNLVQLNEWIRDNLDSVAGTFPTTITFPNDGNPLTVEFGNIATALEEIYIALNSGDMTEVEIKIFSSCKTAEQAEQAKQTNSIIKNQTYDQAGNKITDPGLLPLVSESANYSTKKIKVPGNQVELVKHYFDEVFKLQAKHCEQGGSIISRIYKILGGDVWFKDANSSSPALKSRFDDVFKKGAIANFDGEGKEKEVESSNLLTYVNQALSSLYYRTGIYQFPTKVQETMLTYSDGAEQVDVNDFTTYFAWFLDQFDLLMGQFPIQIKIEDTDLAKEGNQSLTVEMPNLSEALAETYGLAISASANADLAINFLMRLASEVIATKNATLITQDYAKANSSFLGYRGNPKAREVDYSFNPADMSAFDKFLQNSKGQIVGWSDESKETLIDYLQRLMYSAGIIKSVFMRNKDQVNQLKKELEALMTNPDDEKAWKEFIAQINNPRSIFNQGDESATTPPHFLDNKPVINPEEEAKKDGKGT